MIGFLILPLILAALIIVFLSFKKYLRLLKLKKANFLLALAFIILFSGLICLVLGFFLPLGTFKRILNKIGYYWLGVMLFVGLSFIFCLLARGIVKLILKKKYIPVIAKTVSLIFIILFSSIMSVYGIYNAHRLKYTNYEINVEKTSRMDKLNVVLISDLHLGYNVGSRHMEDMVKKVNELKPDVILLAGDVFDNEYDALDDPERLAEILSGLKSKFGTYACLGNHDIDETIFMGFTFSWLDGNDKIQKADERMIEFLEKSNINLLYDEAIMLDDIYLVGRADLEKPNLGNQARMSCEELIKPLNNNRPIIVLDHEPRDGESLAKLGVDVLLNGHAHAGQVWPGTLTINYFWDNPYGYKKYGKLHNIVTSGVGLFGINMRVDSNAEICNIRINFNN